MKKKTTTLKTDPVSNVIPFQYFTDKILSFIDDKDLERLAIDLEKLKNFLLPVLKKEASKMYGLVSDRDGESAAKKEYAIWHAAWEAYSDFDICKWFYFYTKERLKALKL